jgi:hypothetical protein
MAARIETCRLILRSFDVADALAAFGSLAARQ